jgi:hypothetical protein
MNRQINAWRHFAHFTLARKSLLEKSTCIISENSPLGLSQRWDKDDLEADKLVVQEAKLQFLLKGSALSNCKRALRILLLEGYSAATGSVTITRECCWIVRII